ncbi:MAG: M48 family metallopeptidase [Rhodospirillales bacterium]
MAAVKRAVRVFETDYGPQSVEVRRDRRARNITLRVDASDSTVVLTAPPWAPKADIENMIWTRAGWIRGRLAEIVPRVPFTPGARVPVLGAERTLVHEGGRRGPARLEGEFLIAPGAAEHFARRIEDWLKAEAKRAITPLADGLAERAGLRRGRISVRDTKSRWGSCAPGGGLSFSWRLVMAPEYVLDYIVAHEVAHLAHADHSRAFWAKVESLTPHRAAADRWLNTEGAKLHRYG